MPEFVPDARAEALREKYGFDIIPRDGLEVLIEAAVAAPRKRILEIGTSVGYSALCLATATGAHVDTVERDESKLDVAEKLWADCGASNSITAHLGDAERVVPELVKRHKYDFVFIDAAKSKYCGYLDAIYDFIDTGTVIVADDVNFLGLVKGDEYPPHKHRTIVTGMRRFVRAITDASRFECTMSDVGGGVAVCTKI